MVKLSVLLLDSILKVMWLFFRKSFGSFEERVGYLQSPAHPWISGSQELFPELSLCP